MAANPPDAETTSSSSAAAAAAAATATSTTARGEQQQPASPQPSPSPPPPLRSPPFWTFPLNQHGRSVSEASHSSLTVTKQPSPIIKLEDHTAGGDDDDDGQAQACWARHVSVDDYLIVSGATGVGAYVVWICTVETQRGAPFTINKRFSEFDKLRSDLVQAFPHAEASIPPLPRKSLISRFRPKFLDARRAGLSHFLQ